MVRSSKRQAILDAALRVLKERGLEGFSASRLAEAAGVGKATLFHHFATLDDVVFESFDQFSRGMDIIAPPKGMTLRSWLEGIGNASFGLDETGHEVARAYFVFIGRALFDERLRTRVLGTVNAAADAFCGIVAQLCPGPLAPDEARALGTLIFVTADGMAIHLQAFPERRTEIQRAWKLFVNQVAPSEDGKETGE